MTSLSRPCVHEGCTNLVVSGDKCHLHDGTKIVQKKKKPPINLGQRIISVSKDGKRTRAYKQCTHEGCANIAKKGGRCYAHGAPRKTCSAEGCKSKVQARGLCRKHGRAQDQDLTPLGFEGQKPKRACGCNHEKELLKFLVQADILPYPV